MKYISVQFWHGNIHFNTTVTGDNDTCTTGGNDTNSYSVLVGYPGNTTDITITATLGENVKLVCSRISATKEWTSDGNKITRAHHIHIKRGSGYINLTITSFQLSNAGMYTCGVTLRNQGNETNICGMPFASSASRCNYTVGK